MPKETTTNPTDGGQEDINRSELLKTAIQFLNNNDIKKSSYFEKKQFLLSKGLTKEEIHDVMDQVCHDRMLDIEGSDNNSDENDDTGLFSNVLRYAMYLSGFSLVFYKLWQKYVDEKRRNNELLAKMNANVEQLKASLSRAEENIEKQSMNINNIEEQNKSYQDEIRKSIRSLRSLSIDQLEIPTIPNLKKVPSIPEWQRSDPQTDADIEQCYSDDDDTLE